MMSHSYLSTCCTPTAEGFLRVSEFTASEQWSAILLDLNLAVFSLGTLKIKHHTMWDIYVQHVER
jgi:hypothetical protein